MHVTYWLVRTYARSGVPHPPVFDQSSLPKFVGEINKLSEKLKNLQEDFFAKDEELSALLVGKTRLSGELKSLRAEIATAKAANAKISDTHDYNEEQTRDYFIDLLLNEAGWPLDQPHDREYQVIGMPNATGLGYIDYVLWGDDGKPLAIIEAKRTKRDPRAGQNQAKLYADCLEVEFGQRPIIFYSNGYEHYIWDDTRYPPRVVQGFFKKDELELIIQRRTSREVLKVEDVNKGISGRPYQLHAIQRIVENVLDKDRRKALLVMATGAGKTRTVIGLSGLLMQKNWAKRILFLADRVALVNQAVSAFKAYLPSASVVNLVNDKNSEGRIYVSTYPTMMGLIDGKNGDTRKFGPGHFDLIVIDEAHRSVYQKYRAVFEYFDSYLIGLTATPREEIDRNTFSLFDLEESVPTDSYTLDKAIEEGYLVQPVSLSVPLKFPREGIKYDQLPDEEKEQWDALDWSEDGEKPNEVVADDVNRWLFNIGTVDTVITNVMQSGIKVAGGDRLGKTIIFAKNQNHAEFILDRFNINYPHYKGKFAQVITFKTEYAQNLIDNFSIAGNVPHIAISVDMLDTGIDVPEVVNLVLFKRIRSKTKFWQILGRGTRLCPNLFGPGGDKSEFYVFDYCQNLEYFSQDMEEKSDSLPMSLVERLFQLRLELIQTIDAKRDQWMENTFPEEGVFDERLLPEEKQIRQSTAQELLATIQAMNLDNFIVRAKREYVDKYSAEGAWKEIDDMMIDEVVKHIAPLPSAHSDSDEMAKRFDVLCLNLQLCILKANEGFKKYSEQVVKIAEALIMRQEVPAVKAQLEFLYCVTEEDYWQNISVPMLEVLRVRVRKLVKHIDKSERKIVYTNFEDELGSAEIVNIIDAAKQNSLKFHAKAKAFLRNNLNHTSLSKLQMNKPLTPADSAELERLFAEFGEVDKVLLKHTTEHPHGLSMFARSLIGLDKSAAQDAFSNFIKEENPNTKQLQFIKMIIDYLTERGVVSVEFLYGSPFTNEAPQGPESIFTRNQMNKIISILDEIKNNACSTIVDR